MNHESRQLWHDSVIHDSVIHDSVRLHIVGGFLGSGKTTAIIGAAKYLMAQGKRVGVVTNDQGKYLVDTAFFTLADVPTVEVTGGCFCCHYDDLDARLAQLQDTAQPDVIFAESVGSCADIVATVVKPLLTLRQETPPTSFSVFTDARLLRRRLLDQPMPFSDDVVYIFDKQIEEAGLLVINKVDLLDTNYELRITNHESADRRKSEKASERERESAAPASNFEHRASSFELPASRFQNPKSKIQNLMVLAQQRFPHKAIRLQNSLDAVDIAGWVDWLESGELTLPGAPLEIDYARYGAGEARLAWLDETLTLRVPESRGREATVQLVHEIVDALRAQNAAIGHLKFLVQAAGQEIKLSFPTLAEAGWEQQIPALPGAEVAVLVNARVEMEAEALRRLVQSAVGRATVDSGATVSEADVAAFHPGFPNPTHRISTD